MVSLSVRELFTGLGLTSIPPPILNVHPSGNQRQSNRPRDDCGNAQKRDREVLRRRHISQEKDSGTAEKGPNASDGVWLWVDSPASVYCGAADGRGIASCRRNFLAIVSTDIFTPTLELNGRTRWQALHKSVFLRL